MITIKNKQRKIVINTKKLKQDAQKILDALDYADYDLGIWLTTNKIIHRYNKEYRHKDKPTDILSFPFHPDLKAGEQIKPTTPDEKNLGDLIISLEYVQKAAQELGENFYNRLQMLLVHGICHLLGYDHEKDKDFEVMKKKEKELLEKISG
jgi:rRNA maturation RNase YbeY